MATDLEPAFVGFLGVLVGAIITTGANYFLAVRKEKADETRAKLARTNQIRTAARLIRYNLMQLSASIDATINTKMMPLSGIGFPLTEWDNHKEVLAAELSDADWADVIVAVLAGSVVKIHQPDDLARAAVLDHLRRIQKLLDHAASVLEPCIGKK
ncbi:MAG: hypothetical protein ACLPKB_32830 [Xanthobacteraceae bacterium]